MTAQPPTATTPGTTSMRSAATWFLDQQTLPRHESVRRWSRDLSDFLQTLIREIEPIAARLPKGDVPACVAMAGVGEARRRLTEPDAAGLYGEVQRVRRLARSVLALCDHRDSLTGVAKCLACDRPLEDGQPTQPYDKVSPSGGAARPGRIHTGCAGAGRPQR
ncbi:DUF6415 family natural product biosynthesis protein [Streptomyces sp. NPDC007110]|uniref:DUF6415 family natural product biosynthesis protein n=1 Tax=Streptomyces sp. NPDC007110 TaxID=3156916 RepID=UPI0033EF1C7B